MRGGAITQPQSCRCPAMSAPARLEIQSRDLTARVIVARLNHSTKPAQQPPSATETLKTRASAAHTYFKSQHTSHITPAAPAWSVPRATHPSQAPANHTNRASANLQASRRAPRRHARPYHVRPIIANAYTRRRSCLQPSSVCSATTRSPSPCPLRRSPVSAICNVRSVDRLSRPTSIVRGTCSSCVGRC